jgi:thermostable 8-oxoguanine DNA glycosylase
MTRSRIPADILSNGRAFIEAIAASNEMREKYGKRPAASKGHVRNAILFGILTANERYEASEKALTRLSSMTNADLDDITLIPWVLKVSGIMTYNVKAHAIAEFIERFEANPTPFHPLPDESCSEYRDRLFLMNIRGLGYVKTSFAAYLAYGGGNVICADRHILNIYTHGNFKDWMHRDSKASRAVLEEVEQYFVGLAAIYEWPSASALQ